MVRHENGEPEVLAISSLDPGPGSIGMAIRSMVVILVATLKSYWALAIAYMSEQLRNIHGL